MQKSMAYWGPDGVKYRCDGPAGLGHLMQYDTPESLHENLPLQNKSGTLLLTAAARLDNRDDLFRTLNVPSSEHSSMTDSGLIMKAYERWGYDCPAHLLGDWSFAVWDPLRNRLFLVRDHYGVSGLYFYRNNRFFAFASSIKGLLALPNVPRQLNPIALPGTKIRANASTPYKGIQRLTPAQAMVVTKSKMDIWHHWHPNNIPDVRLSSDQAYLDAFSEVYTKAVHCRLRSHRPIGVMLSGGLDSGSIATLAAHQLARNNQTLFAFSSVPLCDVTHTTDQNRCGDESQLIEATRQSAGNIDLTYIKAENTSPIAAIKRYLGILALPHATINSTWALALAETAQRQGINSLLDGWGGNFTVSWTGNREKYLLALLKEGDLNTYIQEICNWRQTHQTSLWRTVQNQVIRPFIPPVWLERLLQYRRYGRRRQGIINKAARQSMSRFNHLMIDNEATNSSNPGLYHYFRNGHIDLNSELGAAFGLVYRQPAMDKRVIEFCLGIPQNQYMRDGKDKLLIRRAMADLMPENVLWNQHRGIQSADIGQRIRASSAEVTTVLQQLDASELAKQYIDLPYLHSLLRNIQQQLNPSTMLAASHLVQGITVGLWLQRF